MTASELPSPAGARGQIATRNGVVRSWEPFAWGASTVVMLVLAWELLARVGIFPERFTSSPTRVVATGIAMLRSGELTHDTLVTLTEFGIGMAVAIGLGIPIGLAAGWYRRLQYALEPYLAALYATPSLALLPLLVLWFGIGLRSTIALVVISAFFPLVINVMYGVHTVDLALLRMARSFRANQLTVFRDIVLPGTIPFLASGLQLGVARGLIGVIIGEMYSAYNGGLGYEIAVAGASVTIDRMFVAVATITALGIVLMGSMAALERRLQHWKPKATE